MTLETSEPSAALPALPMGKAVSEADRRKRFAEYARLIYDTEVNSGSKSTVMQSHDGKAPIAGSVELELGYVTEDGLPFYGNGSILRAVPASDAHVLLPKDARFLFCPSDLARCYTPEVAQYTGEGQGPSIVNSVALPGEGMQVVSNPKFIIELEGTMERLLENQDKAVRAVSEERAKRGESEVKVFRAAGIIPSLFGDDFGDSAITEPEQSPRYRQLGKELAHYNAGEWTAEFPMDEGANWIRKRFTGIGPLGSCLAYQFHLSWSLGSFAKSYNDFVMTDGYAQAFSASGAPVEWEWVAHDPRYFVWKGAIGGRHRPELEEGSLVFHGRGFWDEADSRKAMLGWFKANCKRGLSFVDLPEVGSRFDYPVLRTDNGQAWTVFSRPCLFSTRNHLLCNLENRCKGMMNPRNAAAILWWQLCLTWGLRDIYPNVLEMVTWDQAKENLLQANLKGNRAKLWFFGRQWDAADLKEKVLDLAAQRGHELLGFSDETFERFSKEMRLTSERTGSTLIKGYMSQIDRFAGALSPREKGALLTRKLLEIQDVPWSEWPLELSLAQDDLVKF